jgi:hypothetical protein
MPANGNREGSLAVLRRAGVQELGIEFKPGFSSYGANTPCLSSLPNRGAYRRDVPQAEVHYWMRAISRWIRSGSDCAARPGLHEVVAAAAHAQFQKANGIRFGDGAVAR